MVYGFQAVAEAFRGIVCHMSLVFLATLLSAAVIAWLAKTLAIPVRRVFGGGIVRAVLAVAMVGTGIVESFSKHANAPPRRAASPMLAVTPTDISNGWRVAATREDRAPSRPQDGTCTIHEPWLLRGGFKDIVRIPFGGWLFPWCGGFADGLTVFSDGKIRPALRTPYFPRPLDVPLAVVPAFNWHQLPGGVSNVFWHASTPSNSLVVAWENSPVNYDASSLTNFQAEFCADGRFAYRYDDRVVDYAPVFPFDWDDDGLENSVDPDPLAAGSDAHGTNAEWYNTVCSNVLAAVATGRDPPNPDMGGMRPVASVELTWREGVNSNAYYFVDVVAERGPAPIYFTGDRDSRLGNPVVVARGGETNHVPLLIGINYAVTSDMPFSVSFPVDYIHPTVTTNGVADYNVRWPLNFAFTESISDSCRIYTANVEPYDPGGTFTGDPPLRGAPCGCVSFSGNAIVFGCSPTCGCGGNCPKGILYYLLGGATFSATGGVCRCGFDDPVPPDPVSYAPTNTPSLSITFSKPAVIFENAYLDSEYGVRPKRSTRVQLTVSAYGGTHGGSLSLSSQNLEKLSAVAGGTIDLPTITNIAPCESFFSTCIYEAADVSGSMNDIRVLGTFTENETSAAYHSEDSLTAVRLEFTPDYQIDNYPHRHRVGVRERAKCSWLPADVAVTCEAGTGGSADLKNGIWHYRAPLTAGASPYLTAVCQGVRYPLALDMVEPQSVVAKSAEAFDYGVPTNVAGGAGMELELVILPTNVSFMGIAVQEIPSDYKDPQGYFANSYFDVVWSHTTNRGAGVWHNIQVRNRFMYDYAEMGDRLPNMTPSVEIADEDAYGWISGTMNWFIPVGWNENGSDETVTPVKLFCVYWQRFRMASDGTLEVEKLGNVVQRKTNTVVRLNGKIVPLRPR